MLINVFEKHFFFIFQKKKKVLHRNKEHKLKNYLAGVQKKRQNKKSALS
jgi:hypothetical protein